MDTISSLAARYVSWLNFLLLTLFGNCNFEVGRHHTKVVVFGAGLHFQCWHASLHVRITIFKLIYER